MANKRGVWFFVTYHYAYLNHPENPNYCATEEDYYNYMNTLFQEIGKQARLMAVIHHNECINDETKKEVALNTHLLVLLKDDHRRTKSAAASFFKVSNKENIAMIKPEGEPDDGGLYAIARYMLHISDGALADKKTMYALDRVVFKKDASRILVNKREINEFRDLLIAPSENEKSQRLQNKKEAFAESIRKQVLEGKMNPVQAFKELENSKYKYETLELVRLDRDITNVVDIYKRKKANLLSSEKRLVEVINIICSDENTTGIGKSKIARELAKKRKGDYIFKCSIPGKKKTPDLFGHYGTQPVAILNEFNGYAFKKDEFKSIFDREDYQPISSRNSDTVCLAEEFITTTSENLIDILMDVLIFGEGRSLSDFRGSYNNRRGFTKEFHAEMKQLARRMYNNFIFKKDPKTGDLNIYFLGWDRAKRGKDYLNRGFFMLPPVTIKDFSTNDEKNMESILWYMDKCINYQNKADEVIYLKWLFSTSEWIGYQNEHHNKHVRYEPHVDKKSDNYYELELEYELFRDFYNEYVGLEIVYK